MRDPRHTRTLPIVFGACVVLATPGQAQLTLRLTGIPADTTDLPVYVAGSFNRWNPGDPAFRLTPAGGTYVLTLPDTIRGPVEFKFTRGSFERVETDSTGREIANRSFVVPAAGGATYTATVQAWRDPRKWPLPHSTAPRGVSIAHYDFPMPQLGRSRRIWVYLPPDYETSDRRYPVLYMHDGQNVFDHATSYAGEWGVDEALDSLHAAGDWGAIVVAVDNGAQHRMNEYSPWVHPQAGGGEGDRYVDFLVETLKPWVDARYRTRPDRLSTGVMGSSMGGLISLHAALRRPDVFGRAGVFSPSLWFSPDAFAAARAARRLPGQRWYFVSGGKEGPAENPGVVVQGQTILADTLAAAGFERGAEIHEAGPEDGTHQEWFWRREFPAAYRWLFAPPPASSR